MTGSALTIDGIRKLMPREPEQGDLSAPSPLADSVRASAEEPALFDQITLGGGEAYQTPPSSPAPPTQSDSPPPSNAGRFPLWLIMLLLALALTAAGLIFQKRLDHLRRAADQQRTEQQALQNRLDNLNQATIGGATGGNSDDDDGAGDFNDLNVSGAAVISSLTVTDALNLNGLLGLAGQPDSPGTSGPAGPSGSDGAQGIQGDPGLDGSSGPPGATGATGPAGPQGPSGTASCPNDNCLSLQAASPGTAEAGHVNITGTLIAGQLQGDGSGITNLDAGNIAIGTLADARLSSAVSLLGQTISLAELESDSVNSAKIVDGSVANADLQNSSLTITAGGGLSGGGTIALGGTTSFNIGAGDGISVSSDTIAVDSTVCRATNNCGFQTSGDYFLQGGNSFGGLATLGTNDNFGLALETNGLERLRIDPSGNIGIGNTAPAEKLEVTGKIATSGSAAALVINSRSGSASPWQLFNPNGELIFNGGFQNRAAFLPSGNIGIGTITPTGLLQVTQPVLGYGRVTTNGTTTLTGNFNTQFTNTFKVGDNVTVGTETRTIASIAGNSSLTVTSAFTTSASGQQYTLVGGDRLKVLGNGNVGIGTTTPGYKLDVSGGTGIIGQFSGRVIGGEAVNGNEFVTKSQLDASVSGTCSTCVNLQTTTPGIAQTGNINVSGRIIAGGTIIADDLDTQLGTFNIGQSAATIVIGRQTGGTVQLGGNSGSANDAINIGVLGNDTVNLGGTAYSSVFNFRSGVDTGAALNLTSAGTALALRVNDDGTDTDSSPFVIDSSGNVGIGTATPTELLHVAGDSLVDGGLTVVQAAVFQSTLSVTGNATFNSNITVGGKIIGNADTRGQVTIPSGATTATHTFATAYAATPNIVATPTTNPGAYFWVSNITTTAFTINLAAVSGADTTFNFQAQQ